MAHCPEDENDGKVIITLRVPAALARKLKAEAKKMGVSLNALILMKVQARD